jgi:hypothetical protein
MANPGRSVDEILQEAREMLRTAQLGLADLEGKDPARRLPGLRNGIVFGRAVTNVLENLRNRVPNFDGWYKPHSKKLSLDPGFKRLYEMRSEILKRGQLSGSVGILIEHMNTDDFAPLMRNPPIGAKGFFIGDQGGGAGWEIELPSGAIERYYVKLPVSVDMKHLFTVTTTAGDEDASALLRRYLDTMQSLVAEAERRFVH